MARKRKHTGSAKKPYDLSSWNFIIFLTLAFILLVIVVNAVTDISVDLRSRALSKCPSIQLPRAEDCPGDWTFKRASDGCVAFFCEAK